MKLFVLLAIVLSSGLAARAETLAKGEMLSELHLRNGMILHNVKIVSVDSTSIMANWDEGRGNILAASLPPEIRQKLPAPSPKATNAGVGDKSASPARGSDRDPVKPPDPVSLHGSVGDETGPAQTITGQIVITARDGSLVNLAGVRVYAFGKKEFGELNNQYYTQVNPLFEYYQTMTHRQSAQHDFVKADWNLERMESLFDQDLAYFPKGPRAESNADGKFQLQHTLREPYVVTARATRYVNGKTERYRWVIDSANIKGGRLLLSIDNLKK